jgi:hypothetical protein
MKKATTLMVMLALLVDRVSGTGAQPVFVGLWS